jgi:hypothetical protein
MAPCLGTTDAFVSVDFFLILEDAMLRAAANGTQYYLSVADPRFTASITSTS